MTRNLRFGREHDLSPLLNLNPYSHVDRLEYRDDAVRETVRANPNAAKRKSRFTFGKNYPLTMAVSLGASLDVVQLLCDACPSALQEGDGWFGWTPLHLAVYWSAPSEVVTLLVERSPAIMDSKDKNDRTPIDLAREYGASPEIQTLLGTLHDLFYLDPSDEEVLKMLLESNGEMWNSRTGPILHLRTAIVNGMGLTSALMPTLLGRVGQASRVQTMFAILREAMSLFNGVCDVDQRTAPDKETTVCTTQTASSISSTAAKRRRRF